MSKSRLSYGSFDVNYFLVPQLEPKLQGKVSEMILLLCMQPWFSGDSKPIKMAWKSIFWIHNPKNLIPH